MGLKMAFNGSNSISVDASLRLRYYALRQGFDLANLRFFLNQDLQDWDIKKATKGWLRGFVYLV